MLIADTVPVEQASRSYSTDDERWAALLQRDGAADSAFYYSVRTTGVYCRPSCGARKPRRENVRFHLAAADAESAGFRPCKRCRPDEPSLAMQHTAAVAKACRLIQASDEVPGLDELAASAELRVLIRPPRPRRSERRTSTRSARICGSPCSDRRRARETSSG